MVMRENEGEPIKLTKKLYINPTFGSVYLKKSKRDNDKIM